MARSQRIEDLPPFPEDVPAAPLVTIQLRKLLQYDKAEHAALFEAAKSLGFFYIDMRGCPEGEDILKQADSMFELASDFFSLPEEEKRRYDFAAQGKYFGYKGVGKEVIDGKGTRDRNEIYNVGTDIYHSGHRY
jgi:isopenicillin N synthase-like dioxygenase